MPAWLKNAVFYEIYPQSFQDTNADGIGDFQGIIDRLPYLKELGCNAIWMNPCYDSPFNDAGYDVRNYYLAAPRYGTNEDLKRLFREVHRQGMHLILDLVPGHTSIDCPWFLESCKAEKNEYTGRYIWSDSVWESMTGVENIAGVLRGISPRDASVATNFFSTQPALNYGFVKPDKPWQSAKDSPEALATREAMKDIMRFWLSMGADGFRVDMAGSLIKGEGGRLETIKLWQDVRAFLDREFPEAALISEWGIPDESLAGGFHMDFLLTSGESHYNEMFRTEHPYFSAESTQDAADFIRAFNGYRAAVGGKGLICIPSGNHDTPRLRDYLTVDEMRLAFAFLLTMPGAPYIYYGDEIGMRYLHDLVSVEGGYQRTGTRTPMQWDHTPNSGFSSAPKEKLYITMDPDPDRPTVQDQQADASSLWHTVQQLLTLRMSHTALQTEADFRFVGGDCGRPALVYRREDDAEKLLIAINPKKEAAVLEDVRGTAVQTLYVLGEAAALTENGLTVPGRSATVLLLS